MIALALAACAPPALPTSSQAQVLSADERARLENEIRGLEERFNRDYERNDMGSYWAYYADDSSQLWDDGRVGMEKYRKDWTAFLASGGAVREIRLEDLQAQVSPSGDAAVASYRIYVRLKDARGKESSGWYHESDVWFRRDGAWKLAYTHYSRVGPSPMPPGAAGPGPGLARSRPVQVW